MGSPRPADVDVPLEELEPPSPIPLHVLQAFTAPPAALPDACHCRLAAAPIPAPAPGAPAPAPGAGPGPGGDGAAGPPGLKCAGPARWCPVLLSEVLLPELPSAGGKACMWLPDAPYAQEKYIGKASCVAARRRSSRPAAIQLCRDRQLQSNLMWAVRFNDLDRVRQLVAMGCDANEPDALGRTPLHVAASQGYADMVELLLRQGARPDPCDRRQNTPLHLAVCTSRWRVTQRLLEAGASVWRLNGMNMSALQLARGKLNMVLRLKMKGTLDYDKHIEQLRAVHDLVKSALGSRRMPDSLEPDPASLASVLDQIENLTISAPSLADISGELRHMSLATSGAAAGGAAVGAAGNAAVGAAGNAAGAAAPGNVTAGAAAAGPTAVDASSAPGAGMVSPGGGAGAPPGGEARGGGAFSAMSDNSSDSGFSGSFSGAAAAAPDAGGVGGSPPPRSAAN